MSDIQRGITFTTSIPDAASAHQLVDNATILPAFVTGKTAAIPTGGADFLFASPTGALRKCTLTTLIGAFPNGGAASVYALRRLGTTGTTAAAGDDSRFPAVIRGIRQANGPAIDSVATPAQLSFASRPIVGLNIDWSQSQVFTDSLAGNKTYTFSNVTDGRIVHIIVTLNGRTVTMPVGLAVNTLGTGTTIKHYILVKSAVGTTGLCIAL